MQLKSTLPQPGANSSRDRAATIQYECGDNHVVGGEGNEGNADK